MKKLAAFLPIVALLVAGTAAAHVSVKPAQVGVGTYQTFTVSVPNEKDIPTASIRLVIPKGVESVTPTVKPGWTISTDHIVIIEEEAEGEGDNHDAEAPVDAIVWTGGTIPAGFRDEFTFSAKVPASETSLSWKAYQTYRNGPVVAWELATGEKKDAAAGTEYGPASITKVVNDLNPAPAAQQQNVGKAKKDTDALFVSLVAVVLSVLAIYLAKRNRGVSVK